MKRLSLLLAIALLAVACGTDDGTGDGGSADCELGDISTLDLKADGTLTVATGEPVFPPWMIDDDPSNGQGFESAVVYAVADELGFEPGQVEWVRTGFTEAIVAGEKDYDFNVQQYTITEERDQVVDFSDGYYALRQAIVGYADSAAVGATSVADLQALRIGAQIGTTSLDYIENIIEPEQPAAVYDTNADAKAALDADQVDALVFDLPTAYFVTAVEIEGSVILGQLEEVGDQPEELGFLFEEGSTLVQCVNEALASLRDAGTLADIEQEWLAQGGDIPTISR
ncbi:MAG: ABC transporter substrate-binding protein [Acidimicrobiia bacterium]|nr:ABC transporter substrate-binding protein [Acidimicrobiia bacterium]